ncbi:MAG: hypothetical protein JKX84_00210 [Flavobacteriales bacterium]|nr:hypothetical protein [Flavobacteriales bacterium]
MVSGRRALGFLLILCGILLNPYLLAKLFSNDGNITSGSLLFGVILIESVIVILGVTVIKKNNEAVQKLGISLFSVILIVFVSIGADRFYGRFLMPETANILFPAFAKAEHHTSEFELDVRINNLGFRGPDVAIAKKKKRVLVIGDSFTFGWGVEVEETWIHLLSEKYPNVEFLNLGQGGNHPGDHVRTARKAVPLLKPDLVMVTVLQGNDIHQLMRLIEFEKQRLITEDTVLRKESSRQKIQRYLWNIYPNMVRRFPLQTTIKDRWEQDARNLFGEVSPAQKRKYESLNQKIRKQFENGLLNPSLIYESLHHPNIIRESVDTSDQLCKKAIVRLHDHLLELKEISGKYGAELLVLSLPNRPYGFSNSLEPLAELGFNVEGCDSLDAHLPIELATVGTDVPLLSPVFGNKHEKFFYRYDGHWNRDGNSFYANTLDSMLCFVLDKKGNYKTWKALGNNR